MRLVVEREAAPERLDRFLCRALGRSRSEVRRWLEAAQVRIDGRLAHKGESVSAGAVIELSSPPPSSAALPEPEAPLSVRYEDASFVVVDKPRGQPCHPLLPGERGTLANALVARYPELRDVGFGVREPGLVHRIDNDTSGLVLAARSRAAFTWAREALEGYAVDKGYLAVTTAAPARISIETGLAAEGARRVRCVEAAPSYRTDVRRVEQRGDGLYWVWVRVGRAYRHQVRVHLAALGAPLVGDTRYGGAEREGLVGHALHAFRIAFEGPDGRSIEVESEPPAELPGQASKLSSSEGPQ